MNTKNTTFETDPVFKNYEDAEKYLESYVKPTIEKSRYGYFTATVLPDGLGGKYLVSGFIDSHSEDEEVIKGNKETAQKIVDNAGKPMPISESVKPAEEVKPVTPTKPVDEVKPETPAKPVEDVKPKTPTKPVEDVKPETPTKPVEEVKPETPTTPEKDVKSETPAKPENNKNNNKKTLPNTGESTSILGIIGSVLSITGLGFIVKRKRG